MTDTSVDPVASAEIETVTTAASGAMAAPDLSILGMFMQADFVVKSVMILLLLASFWSWANHF